MKKKNQILYFPMALIMLLMLSLPSCSFIFDDYPQEDAVINISLTDATTRNGNLLTNDDAEIEKVRIIVFSGNYAEANKLFVADNPNDFINLFTVDVVTGSKSIYVVANETTTLTSALSAVTTKSGLMQVMSDVINSNSLAIPLVMSGKLENVTVSTGNNGPVAVELKRLAAKITLNIKKDTNSEVIINKISLLNNKGKSVLWEGENIIGTQSHWDLINNNTNLTLNSISTDALSAYVYENIGNSASNKTNATKLVMEGTYAGMNVNYSVYVNEHILPANATGNSGDPSSSIVTGDTDYYNIKRNHHYNITATIKSYGITILTEVKDWTEVNKTAFTGYGYTVEIDGTKVTIRNGDADCSPHTVELIAKNGLTIDGGSDVTFTKLEANASETYTLSNEPSENLEVWYNDVHVHTF